MPYNLSDPAILGPEATRISNEFSALEEQFFKYENPHTEAPPELMAKIRTTVAAFEDARRRYYDSLPDDIKLLQVEVAMLSKRYYKKLNELQIALKDHDARLGLK